ncbi:MAG: hypothetical protein L0H93_19565 [Nocardioides sp.]|nr:hypothetical protein [Nocardioides sp.]
MPEPTTPEPTTPEPAAEEPLSEGPEAGGEPATKPAKDRKRPARSKTAPSNPAAKTSARTTVGEGRDQVPVLGTQATVQTTISIDPELAAWVREQARAQRVPQTAIILDALNQAAKHSAGWTPLLEAVAAPARTVASGPDDLFQYAHRSEPTKELFKVRFTPATLAQVDQLASTANAKRSTLISAALRQQKPQVST